MNQPFLFGWEQLQSAFFVGSGAQSHRTGSVVERHSGPRVER
jgi:hypothetical protein